MAFTAALLGNPNVGKSSVFNALTGLNQHTGNWTGKTVETAEGKYIYNGKEIKIVDLPGTYSLNAHSAEEEVSRDYITNGNPDAVVIICNPQHFERSLNLLFQTLEVTGNVIFCVNMIDEARKNSINIDKSLAEQELNVPVVFASARTGEGIDELKKQIAEFKGSKPPVEFDYPENAKIEMCRIEKAEGIAKKCVKATAKGYLERDKRLDKLFIGKWTAVPIMLILLALCFWITVFGANYISDMLFDGFALFKNVLVNIFNLFNTPLWVKGIFIDGIYGVTTWVISVMLPPMAIFFPLFALLEDSGYLPRIAFNLDKHFQRCGTCGKHALTCALGMGCNAVGVTGCRIISSPRERLIAILTNSFIPCNGRFPAMIAIISMFMAGGVCGGLQGTVTAFFLLLVIMLGVFTTLACSYLLSKTLLKGMPSAFIMELPSYRKPQILKTMYRALKDKVLKVLWRAVIVAMPAGAVIWILANVQIHNVNVLIWLTEIINPAAALIGLDGAILIAFILGLPANEIVIPIMLMIYMSSGTIMPFESLTALKEVL
ncbi:MAG: ferrous iron transporter B, partial [Clostridia bacterium]|nr:ferrous iron transporter B [Clostridia bacterium]